MESALGVAVKGGVLTAELGSRRPNAEERRVKRMVGRYESGNVRQKEASYGMVDDCFAKWIWRVGSIPNFRNYVYLRLAGYIIPTPTPLWVAGCPQLLATPSGA